MAQPTAIVTGSTRGIGRSIADTLAQAGYAVVYSGTKPQAPDTIPKDAFYLPCDISVAEQRQTLLSATLARLGRVDVLVNNAGVAPETRRDILETTEESFDRVLGINLRGTFFLTQQVACAMIRLQSEIPAYRPRIINIGSMSAYVSSVSRPEYCISKAGVGMVTALFADRLAEYGIPVFEIRPGIIDTDMTKVVHEKYERLIENGLTPLPRFGMPKDVANMVLAACSGLLDFTTGQVLHADGGYHIRRL